MPNTVVGNLKGPAGVNACSLTTAAFTVPPVGQTVVVPIADASWVVDGQMLWIDEAGGGPGQGAALQVTAKTANSLTLLNSGGGPASGPPGPAGPAGAAGPPGPSEVSANPGNIATLGTDSLIFVPPGAGGVFYGIAGGPSPPAYTLTVPGSFTLQPGVTVYARLTQMSGQNPTLNVNGTGAKPIVTRYGIALSQNEISTQTLFGVTYDGTNWVMCTPVQRIISQNVAAPNTGFQCGGYDGILADLVIMPAAGTQVVISFSPIPFAIPVTIRLFNGTLGNVTYWINASSIITGPRVWYFPTSPTGGVKVQLEYSDTPPGGPGQVLAANQDVLFVGTMGLSNELYLK